MAKKGVKTPEPIRQFVFETKTNAPGLTDRQIVDRVVERFGEEGRIDKSTVQRLVKGLYGELYTSTEDPGQAERSGHWRALRSVAKTLKGQIYAPLPQLLGFPWQIGDWNGALEIGSNSMWHFTTQLTSKYDELFGASEDDVLFKSSDGHILFSALKEHLPDDIAWDLLKD